MSTSRITDELVYAVTPCTMAELEALAEKILVVYNSDVKTEMFPLDARDFAENFVEPLSGWSLDVHETLGDRILGYCDPKTKTFVIPEETYQNLDSDGRCRFTLLHETAHVIKHRHQMVARMITMSESSDLLHRKSRADIKAYMDPEWQADYLAGCLLMPRWHVLKILQDTKYNVAEAMHVICETFIVSKRAALKRIKYIMKA